MGPMTANHEDDTPARPAEPIVSYERPLTPKEAADLGLSPGPSFAEGVKAAMAEAPDIIVLGALPPHITQENRDRGAARPYIIRHHARRFVLFFAVFVVISIVNLVLMFSGVHGPLSFAALVGIAVSTPAFLYHEVKGVRAGGRIGDAVEVVRSVFGRKAKSSNG